jgi:hypothetical protein
LRKDSVFRKATGIEPAPHAMQSVRSPYLLTLVAILQITPFYLLYFRFFDIPDFVPVT